MQDYYLGKVTRRRIRNGCLEYRLELSEAHPSWQEASCVPLQMVQAYDQMHPHRQKHVGPDLAGMSAAAKGHTDSFQVHAEEVDQMCNTQKNFHVSSRRTAGVLAIVRPCQVLVHLFPLVNSESLQSVAFAMAEVVVKVQQANGCKSLPTEEARKEFVRKHFPLTVYDNACTLHRFLRHPQRKNTSEVSAILSVMLLAVDPMHFRGHEARKQAGRHPLPEVWPKTHAHILQSLDSQSCEHTFAHMQTPVNTTRNSNAQ